MANPTVNRLIKEARRLSAQIDAAKLEGKTPSSDVTDRLDVVAKQLIELRKKPPVFSGYAPSEGT